MVLVPYRLRSGQLYKRYSKRPIMLPQVSDPFAHQQIQARLLSNPVISHRKRACLCKKCRIETDNALAVNNIGNPISNTVSQNGNSFFEQTIENEIRQHLAGPPSNNMVNFVPQNPNMPQRPICLSSVERCSNPRNQLMNNNSSIFPQTIPHRPVPNFPRLPHQPWSQPGTMEFGSNQMLNLIRNHIPQMNSQNPSTFLPQSQSLPLYSHPYTQPDTTELTLDQVLNWISNHILGMNTQNPNTFLPQNYQSLPQSNSQPLISPNTMPGAMQQGLDQVINWTRNNTPGMNVQNPSTILPQNLQSPPQQLVLPGNAAVYNPTCATEAGLNPADSLMPGRCSTVSFTGNTEMTPPQNHQLFLPRIGSDNNYQMTSAIGGPISSTFPGVQSIQTVSQNPNNFFQNDIEKQIRQHLRSDVNYPPIGMMPQSLPAHYPTSCTTASHFNVDSLNANCLTTVSNQSSESKIQTNDQPIQKTSKKKLEEQGGSSQSSVVPNTGTYCHICGKKCPMNYESHMKLHAMRVTSGSESPNLSVIQWIFDNNFPIDRVFRCTACSHHVLKRKRHIRLRHFDSMKKMSAKERLDKYFPLAPSHITYLGKVANYINARHQKPKWQRSSTVTSFNTTSQSNTNSDKGLTSEGSQIQQTTPASINPVYKDEAKEIREGASSESVLHFDKTPVLKNLLSKPVLLMLDEDPAEEMSASKTVMAPKESPLPFKLAFHASELGIVPRSCSYEIPVSKVHQTPGNSGHEHFRCPSAPVFVQSLVPSHQGRLISSAPLMVSQQNTPSNATAEDAIMSLATALVETDDVI